MLRGIPLTLSLMVVFPSFSQDQVDCHSKKRPVNELIPLCQQLHSNTQASVLDRFEAGVTLIALYTHKGEFKPGNQLEAQLRRQLTDSQLSTAARYAFFRRSAILSYRQGRYQTALNDFEQAKKLANTDEQEAKVLSDLGTVNMAMGEYANAIESFKSSLALKQRLDNPASSAVTLNNLGNLYLKMSQWAEAETYFARAAHIYGETGHLRRKAHTNENLAKMQSRQHKYPQATATLKVSLGFYQTQQDKAAMLRVLIHLAEQYLLLDNTKTAGELLQQASAIDSELGHGVQTTLLNLNMGRWLSELGQFQQADAVLKSALSRALESGDPEVINSVYDALIGNAKTFHRWELAAEYTRLGADYKLGHYARVYDDKLAKVRAEFEYEQQVQAYDLLEKNHQIKALEVEQRNTQVGLLISLVLLSSLVFFIYVRHLQKVRRSEAQTLQNLMDSHRIKADALGVSLDSITSAFGALTQAIIVADSRDKIIFANSSCLALLGLTAEYLDKRPLADIIPKLNESFWTSLSSDSELDNLRFRDVTVNATEGQGLYQLEVSNVSSGEPVTVIQVTLASDESMPHATALLSESEFHQLLVDLMVYAVESWELASKQSRIELAEQSGIWRVSIDEGRLRTRSLDRYLSIRSLPKNPRWREVLRTGHYVLAECQLDGARQAELSAKLERVNQHLHARALL